MTTVCIVTESLDYEGTEIIASFDDSDEAMEYAENKADYPDKYIDEYDVWRVERNGTHVEHLMSYRARGR